MSIELIGGVTGLIGGLVGAYAAIQAEVVRRFDRRVIFEGRLYPVDPWDGMASLQMVFRNRREAGVELHGLRILHPHGCHFADEYIPEDEHHDAQFLPGGRNVSRFAFIEKGEDHKLTLSVVDTMPGFTFMVEASLRDRETDKFLRRTLTLITPPELTE